MDKFFVCLSNSYKRGGRCVAGVEIIKDALGDWSIVRDENGCPKWVRPVSHTENGEIPTEIAKDIQVMHIVKVTNVRPCPEDAHVENIYYDSMQDTGMNLSESFLPLLVDKTHNTILGNRGRAISVEQIMNLNYSIVLVSPDEVETYEDKSREKSKIRVKFEYRGISYEFPITDPEYLNYLREDDSRFGRVENAYICLSLGIEFEGWHHKLAATIIVPKHLESLPNYQVKKSTFEKTLELYQRGLSLEQIATQRGLNVNTIVSHLVKYVETGSLDIMDFVDVEKIRVVSRVIDQVGIERLAPIKELCPETISYNDIRFVVAAIRCEDG